MWCVCFKPRNKFAEYVEEWENEIDDIISNITRAKRLGKTCMSNRLLGRQDLKLEKDILKLINNIDADIINTKRKAIQFLTDSSTLYNQRNQQLEFYQSYIRKQIHILKMRKELLESKENCKMLLEENELLRQQNAMLLEYFQQHQNKNLQLPASSRCKDDYEYFSKIYKEPFFKSPEFLQMQELSKRQLKTILGKYDQMIENLQQKVTDYKKEQRQIKRENDMFQEEDEEKEREATVEFNEEQIPSEDQEVFTEMSFWLEQELENRKLLQIQSNFGELYYDYQDNFKRRSSNNRLRISFFRTRSERFGNASKDDGLKQPILDKKDGQLEEKPTDSKLSTPNASEEVELIDMKYSSKRSQ